MKSQKKQSMKNCTRLVIIGSTSIIILAIIVGCASANTIDSSTMYFQATLTSQGDGYTGVLRMLNETEAGIGGVPGYDIEII